MPLPAVKSACAAVSPLATEVAQATVAAAPAAGFSVTVKVMLSPSSALASAMPKVGVVGAAATVAVSALSRCSSKPSSSVKLALTLSVLPWSAATGV